MNTSVMIVDRDAELMLAAFSLLHEAGYRVMTTGTLAGAIDAARWGPTIVFLSTWAAFQLDDACFPPDALGRRPMIIVTGLGARLHWGPLAADGFIDTPVTPERLLSAVKTFERAAEAA